MEMREKKVAADDGAFVFFYALEKWYALKQLEKAIF